MELLFSEGNQQHLTWVCLRIGEFQSPWAHGLNFPHNKMTYNRVISGKSHSWTNPGPRAARMSCLGHFKKCSRIPYTNVYHTFVWVLHADIRWPQTNSRVMSCGYVMDNSIRCIRGYHRIHAGKFRKKPNIAISNRCIDLHDIYNFQTVTPTVQRT